MNVAAMKDVAAPGALVRCRDLRKHYGEGEGRVDALRGVDLDVHAGELLMLVGPSGCGKSTLLSILSTILHPDGGRCELSGQDLSALDERQRAKLRRERIGFVFHSFQLLPALSARDNVAIPLKLQRQPPAQATAAAQRMLEAVGLGARAQARLGQLSGGQQQRVAIARALVHAPALVVCDEPTSQLDAASGHAMMELLRSLARTPERALVVVTHDPRILGYADRIARMEDGRIVSMETPDSGTAP